MQNIIATFLKSCYTTASRLHLIETFPAKLLIL
jgi:hypothetical protein